MRIFFIAALLFYALSYIYIGQRLIFLIKVKFPYHYFVYAFCFSCLVLSAAVFLGRRQDNSVLTVLAPLSYVIIGVWAILISFCLVNEIINFIVIIGHRVFKNTFPVKNFRFYSTMICFMLAAVSSIWSIINVGMILRVREVDISVPELKIPSLRIAEISDVHINTFTAPEEIRAIFDKVMLLHADMIVLAGDILDTDIVKDDMYKAYGFDRLKAKYGVFAVSGNHDYYTGIKTFAALCEKNNITVLEDNVLLVKNIINVAGINDINWNREEFIRDIISRSDKNYPVLFLSHRPESFNTVQTMDHYKIIQLSGHTHAGQIPPVEIVRRFFMDYNYGLYEKGSAVMYVSSGVRWWGPPLRLGNMREIALITLKGNS